MLEVGRGREIYQEVYGVLRLWFRDLEGPRRVQTEVVLRQAEVEAWTVEVEPCEGFLVEAQLVCGRM